MGDNLDMTAMYVMHDALRRELEHLAKVTARRDDDPRAVLRTAAGWQLFKTSLHIHHTTEDDALWPALREHLAAQPDELALLETMEAEHAAVDGVIETIDGLLADPEAGPDRLGDLVDSLTAGLTAHLKHEEDQTLPLIQAVATPQQWAHFGEVHGQRVSPEAPRLLPWLLDDASDQAITVMLALLPESARAAFASQWQPAYMALDRWSSGTAA
jgi:iron-sulfur cluster repair protein YtfE (RIC family)